MKVKSKEVAMMMKNLSHPGRLLILCSLLDSEKTVTEIENFCEMSQSQTSQYLRTLEAANLVKKERDGKYRYYSLKDHRTKILMNKLQELYC